MSASFVAFSLVLLAVGAMRLGELWVSVGRMRARPDRVVAEPWLFPWMALLHAGLVFAPIAEVWFLQRGWSPPVLGASVAVLGLATGLRIWTLTTIGRSWNVRVVRPAEDAIATGGPYHFIRHPNYLCVILEIAALPLLHGAWLSAIGLSALNAVVLWFRIRTEEAELMQIPAWRAAFGQRARLLPGVF